MRYGQWIGRAALALIFLFNAFGVVDQTRPANELTAHGAPAALVPTLMLGGRALQLVFVSSHEREPGALIGQFARQDESESARQLVAGIALVVGWHERVAALLLAGFLIPATLTAHDFWAYHGPEMQGQLVNFLKNVAMFGGLCFVAFRLPVQFAKASL